MTLDIVFSFIFLYITTLTFWLFIRVEYVNTVAYTVSFQLFGFFLFIHIRFLWVHCISSALSVYFYMHCIIHHIAWGLCVWPSRNVRTLAGEVTKDPIYRMHDRISRVDQVHLFRFFLTALDAARLHPNDREDPPPSALAEPLCYHQSSTNS
jgi:hypothetical protein